MPQKWIDNKVAVEKEELCREYWDKNNPLYLRAKKLEALDLFWRKYSVLKSELHRYKSKPYGIKRLTYGGNGRRLLIDFDTLRPELQEFLGDPRKADNPLEKYYKVSPDCIEYYTSFKRLGQYLKESEQERYIVNASVIEAALAYLPDWKSNRISLSGNTSGAYQNLLKEVIDFNTWLSANHGITHNLPSNLRTFKAALKAFETDNYYSVIKDPDGKSVQNARKVFEQEHKVFDGLFIDTEIKPSKSAIAKAYELFKKGEATVYNPDTGEVFNPDDYPQLSLSTIISYLSKWESRIATHRKRAGNRQLYIGENIPFAQMDMPEYSGSITSIDDRQPPFWYEKGKRMWFYIGLDVASDCITTFVYGKSKEGIILDFYRQMVRNHTEWGVSLPKELECESALNSSFKDTFLKEGHMFEFVKIEANNAQAKIIERRFGAIRYEYEKPEHGWIPRPHARAEHNQTKPGKTPIIPYNQLAQDRLRNLEDWNNSKHRSADCSRWDYFIQNQHPDQQPTNWAAILPYLGYPVKTSCSRGYIRLQGRSRAIAENGSILTGDALLEKMRHIEGKDLTVFWLDGNDGEVLKALAYYKDRLVCEVMEMPRFNRARAERTDKCREAIKLQMAYKETIDTYARIHANEIVKLGIEVTTPKPERKFKINNLSRYEAKEDYTEVEVIEDMHEDDQETLYNKNEPASVESWQNSFLK